MSAKSKNVSQQKKPGRPKKVPMIQQSDFKGILKEQPKGYDLEFQYTEPSEFKKFMNTFESCGVKELVMHFASDLIRIRGYVARNNTSVDKAPTGCEDALKLIIIPDKTYSYFCNSNFYLRFKISEWEHPLMDVDESCDRITMRYIAKNGSLLFEANNATVACTFKHSVHVDGMLTEDTNTIDSKMLSTKDSANVILENVLCNNLKKILSKPARKKSTGAKLVTRGNELVLVFPVDDKNSEMILPMLSESEYNAKVKSGKSFKEAIQAICKGPTLSEYVFPSADVAKFMIHMKDAKAKIIFANNSALIQITSESSTFAYYKEFS